MAEPAAKRVKTAHVDDKGSEGTSNAVLYSYWRSSCSWRVRIALALKGIDYEYKAIHLVKPTIGAAMQHADGYTKLNSSQEVPTLVIDGLTLCQSLPIIEYLDETRSTLAEHGGDPLLPKNPAERQKVRRISEIINSGIQSVQNLRVLLKVMAFFDEKEKKQAEKIAWGKYWIDHGFKALEKVLEETSGKYCVGDSVTMADCCLPPQVYNANRFKVDMSQFPNINRIMENLKPLKAFEAAIPSNQPDAQ